MITLLLILTLVVLGKMVIFGTKVAWKFGKFMIGLIFLPLLIIGSIFAGLVYLVIPLLAIAGVVLLVRKAVEAV